MSERIRGSYDDALYKSTFTLLYFTSKMRFSYSALLFCQKTQLNVQIVWLHAPLRSKRGNVCNTQPSVSMSVVLCAVFMLSPHISLDEGIVLLDCVPLSHL